MLPHECFVVLRGGQGHRRIFGNDLVDARFGYQHFYDFEKWVGATPIKGDDGKLWGMTGDDGKLWGMTGDDGKLWEMTGDDGKLWGMTGDGSKIWGMRVYNGKYQ
ncbi:hypothetical protein LOTGIDRAFT_174722 [Lottia gigantea]|uniref:Uncharacterized protein n=1 Tax=Lottia gigantea TaxID=225164 RepID=V4ASL3_LOTGI|nr:hypothetical protein LOTGIDRAFT_174722 [Lottia gigantea]ESO96731.1 hypothetical protein LOTGIDRAFT_174722 [Lottia gigantea]